MKKIILGTLAAFALNAAGMAYAAEGDKPADAAADPAWSYALSHASDPATCKPPAPL